MELKKDFDYDTFNKWKQGAPLVVETDMEEKFKQEAVTFVQDGIEKSMEGTSVKVEEACKHIKTEMDKRFGNGWHCIMGQGFSFEVTRQAKYSLLMYYGGKNAVLLFKC